MKTKVNKATHAIVSPQSLGSNDNVNSAQSAHCPNDEQISPKQARPKTKPKPKSTQKRKRRQSSSNSSGSSCEDSIDPAIEKKLKQSALRNNLTHENVKNILHKVVRNDHVLAIVKLKEEELEKHEQAQKLIKLRHDEDEDASAALPKLTRAKAKALNKLPLPLAPLKNTQPDSDVVALINEELRSDDDDEEYQPGDDDIETDDDFNTTTSDIDSQPRTPQTPSSHIEHDEEMTPRTTYTTDGLFKVPRARNESTTSQFEQEYIIAQRTRSKVNLAETPIEAIESNFKAPDVPIDFYGNTDLDPDDLPWSEFMFNYRFDKAPDHEEDEDGDPDYIAADKAPVDKEELRQPKVPKKELEDLLVAHEIDASDNNWWNDFLAIEFGEQSNDAPNSNLSAPVKSSACATEPAADKLLPQAGPTIFTNTTVNPPTIPALPLSTDVAPAASSNYYDSTKISTPMHSYTLPIDINGHIEQRFHSLQGNSSHLANAEKQMSVAPVVNGVESYSHPYNMSLESNASPNSLKSSESTNASPQFILIMPAAVAGSAPLTTLNTQANLPLAILNRQIEVGGPKQVPARTKRTRFKKDRFSELENFDPQHMAERKAINPTLRGITSEQKLILEQQLRMHVQLATQNYMQTYGHPEHFSQAYKFKRFLTELQETNMSNRITNLKPALALIAQWETELSVDSIENTELIRHIQSEMDKLKSNMRYEMRFHERWMKTICHSPVFMYATLLPTIPFRFPSKKLSEYLPSEDYIIAFELERYYMELTEKMLSYKFLKPKKVSLATVCKHIASHFYYLRSAKSIYDYVRLRRSKSAVINPIKYYFMHKKAPTYEHRLIPFDENCVIEPAKRTLHELPPQFAKYVEKLIGLEHGKLLSNFLHIDQKSEALTKRSALVVSPPPKPFNFCSKTFVAEKTNANSDGIDNNHEKSFSIEVIYRNVAHPSHHHHEFETSFNQFDQSSTSCLNCSRCSALCDDTDLSISRLSNRSVSKGQTLLTSYFPVLKKTLPPPDASFTISECGDIDKVIEVGSECSASANNINPNWFRVKIVRKYSRLINQQSCHRQKLLHKLERIVEKSKRSCAKRWLPYRRQPLLLFAFLCIDAYHNYTNELAKMNGLNAPVGKRPVTKATPIDVVVANKRVQKIVNELNGGTTSDEVNAKRLTKGNRTAENARMMLLYENQQESAEKDIIFAQHFFDRVEETFAHENNHQKLNEFFTILRCFDCRKENGAHLYSKLEQLFAPDHLELADLFLNFLQPSDATEIGKFMEHFMYTNMSKFIIRLNLFYQKQPAQMRKVMACLKELSEEEDVKMEKIRNKIVPLLKGNQLLVDWFLQCLGNETAESGNTKDEYETISFRKATDAIDDDTETYEYIPQSEIFPDPNENPCHIRYMNGRLFYGNRLSFPAKLSFSATNSNATTTERRNRGASKSTTCTKMKCENEKESASIASYRCVHDIKEFGNIKIQVKSRNATEIEQTDNSAAEEGEDSEDDQQLVDAKSNDVKCGESNAMHSLCDDKMLKAHGIRLNPSAHSSVIYNNAEMLNMLKPSAECVADSHRECKLSPKKQAPKSSATSTQTKIPRKYSPNAKKTNSANQSSPNRKNSSPPSVPIHALKSAGKLACESPAIQTVKKLKRILETCSTSDEKSDSTAMAVTSPTNANAVKRNLPTTPTVTNKIRKISRSSTSSVDSSGTLKMKSTKDTAEKMEVHQLPPLTEANLCNESDNSTIIKNKDPDEPAEKPILRPPITWSRDEDRLLLEHIKDGLESNHELITREFPTKTVDNIKERIDFLIDFLTKLRNIT